jgi:hypothetical protein
MTDETYYRVTRDDCDGNVGGAFSSEQQARELAESLNESYDTDAYTVDETDDVSFMESLSGTIVEATEKL